MGNDDINRIEQIVREIARHLSKGRLRREFHELMKHRLVNLAKEFGLYGEAEYRVYHWRDDERVGLIDVVWLEGRKPIVAIEVDSSARVKSIQKLLASDALFRLWLYYGKANLTTWLYQHDPEKRIHFIALEGIKLENERSKKLPSK